MLGGEHLLARVEDTSSWWGVRESVLPYLTLGLRGFDLDVEMADLERHLDGDRKEVARQTLAYLDEFERRQQNEILLAAGVAREAHRGAVARSNAALARRTDAYEGRNEEIVLALMAAPETTNADLRARYLTNISGPLLAKLRAEARNRSARLGSQGPAGSGYEVAV